MRLGIIFIIIGIVIIALGIGYRIYAYPQLLYKDFQIISYTVNGKTGSYLVADTEEKREKGLMFFRKLEGVNGMIFQFPDIDYRMFWNKNTLIDLNVLWIKDGKTVGTSLLPSIEKSKDIVTVSSPEPVDTVIEIPQ